MPVLEVYERETTRFEAIEIDAADPFGIEAECPLNPAGHDFIASCGDIVCVHCSKVAWS